MAKKQESEQDFSKLLIEWYLREKGKEALTPVRAKTSVDNNVNRP